MAFSVLRKFVWDGSTVTRGYADRTRGGATVIVVLEGGPDTSDAFSEAINEAVSDVGETYPHESGELPLFSSRARIEPKHDGTTLGFVTLVYRRGAGSPPIQKAFDHASVYTFGSRRVLVWQIRNTGSGTTTDAPLNTWFQPGENEFVFGAARDEPVSQITVPTVLSSEPNTTSLFGMINGSSMTINGISRDQFTLKFMGQSVQPVDVRGGQVFVVEYRYQWFPHGWGTRLFHSREASGGGTEYYVATLEPSRTAAIDNVPVHTPPDP